MNASQQERCDALLTKAIEDACKVQDMTDKQVLAACRPRVDYYKNTYARRTARPCLICGNVVRGTFADLEFHHMQYDLLIQQELAA